MRQARLLAMAAALILFATGSNARTWYVTVDGTGDAPTLHAAADSAHAGDTILVGPGEYRLYETLEVPADVVLESEEGPYATRIISGGPLPVIFGVEIRERAELRGFWVRGFGVEQVHSYTDGKVVGNVIIQGGNFIDHPCTIENNLFVASVYIYQPSVVFNRNIVLYQLDCIGFNTDPLCNDILYLECDNMINQHPQLNFSLDPMFCGVEGSGNYFLQSNSPCAPGHSPISPYCGQVGPLPVGCGTVPVEKITWGAVKAMYGIDEE